MLLYLDALFAEGRDRVVRPSHEIPDTLSKLYVLAMRENTRKALFLHRVGDRWLDVPDWRLDRQVIRLGLFLRERLGLQPGQSVALVAPLRWEWLVADLAVVAQGAVSVAIDPALPDEQLTEALAAARPVIAFVSDGATLGRVQRLGDEGHQPHDLIAFDGPVSRDQAMLLTEVLDVGGTLDTAERANEFRAIARALSPDAPALVHAHRSANGSLRWDSLTQRDVIDRLKRFWLQHPADAGHLAYVSGPEVTPSARLALHALMGDGCTTVALGTPGCEPQEITELRPHGIVAPPAVLARTAWLDRTPHESGRERRSWWAWAARFGAAVRGAWRPRSRSTDSLRDPARWVGPTAPLAPEVAAQLGNVVAVTMDGH